MLKFWFIYWQASSGRVYPCNEKGLAVFPNNNWPDYSVEDLNEVYLTLNKAEAEAMFVTASGPMSGIAFVEIDVRSSDS